MVLKAVWESWEYVSREIRTKKTNGLQRKRLRWIKKESGSQWRSWQCAPRQQTKDNTFRHWSVSACLLYLLLLVGAISKAHTMTSTRQAAKHQPSRNNFSKSSRCSSFIPEVLYHLLRDKWSVNFALIYDSRALEGSFSPYLHRGMSWIQ